MVHPTQSNLVESTANSSEQADSAAKSRLKNLDASFWTTFAFANLIILIANIPIWNYRGLPHVESESPTYSRTELDSAMKSAAGAARLQLTVLIISDLFLLSLIFVSRISIRQLVVLIVWNAITLSLMHRSFPLIESGFKG